MPETEQDRGGEHEDEGRSVGEAGELVVETEHGYLTFGIAWAVIATPAATMTRAESAGSARSARPSKLRRRNALRASTASRPTPVIESARPRLKATISSSPKTSRCRAIAARSTTSADGHGSSPPE